jgi:hypothetical protein
MRAYQLPKGGAGSGPRGSHQLGKTPIWPFPTRISCLSKQCLTTRLILIQKDRRKAVFFCSQKSTSETRPTAFINSGNG